MGDVRKGMLAVAVAVASGAACGGAPVARAVAPAAASTLRELAERQQRLHRAARGDDLALGGDLPITDLVGLRQASFRDALGTPHTCTEPHPPAPCVRPSDWFYSFYHLAEGDGFITIGGGPELLLGFDAQGVCTQAAWRFTQ